MHALFPLSAIATMFVFGYLSLIICPFVYLITQNSIHRCSRCLQTLGVKKCFGLPDDPSQPVSARAPENQFHSQLSFFISPVLAHQTWQVRHSDQPRIRYPDPGPVLSVLNVLCVLPPIHCAPQVLRQARGRQLKYHSDLDRLPRVVLRREDH